VHTFPTITPDTRQYTLLDDHPARVEESNCSVHSDTVHLYPLSAHARARAHTHKHIITQNGITVGGAVPRLRPDVLAIAAQCVVEISVVPLQANCPPWFRDVTNLLFNS
jgi:hypothetical protein